jgi:hypothetical protein
LPGWEEYADKSSKLAALRTETQKAKNSVREALKQRLNEDEIDFATEGDRIRVVRVFKKQQQGRRAALDLSSSFREQSFGGVLEPSGISERAEHPNSNDLDPVTERLMTMLKERG